MVRFDMSEFQERHTVSRLVGAPPGYVGYEEAGQLTETVRRRPYSVLLFDEIEKAHPDIFNILLQILDDGRLTDAQGRTVDFKHTVVIMTSNIGADRIQEQARTRRVVRASSKDDLMQILRGSFRPEFINRIDEIIVFHALVGGAAARHHAAAARPARRGACTRSGSTSSSPTRPFASSRRRDTTLSTAPARCAGRSRASWRTSFRGSCSGGMSSPATASRSRLRTASSGSTPRRASSSPRRRVRFGRRSARASTSRVRREPGGGRALAPFSG